MNVPLSRFLVRFPLDVPPDLVEITLPSEPEMTIGVAAFEARLQAARAETLRDAKDRHAEAIAQLEAARDEAATAAIAAARAEWAESLGAGAAALIETARADLSAMLAERVASVLRPIVAEALVARTVSTLADAIDRLLADPEQPCLVVKGPLDLLDRLRAARPAASIDYQAADILEICAAADGTRIETRLRAALAAIDATDTDKPT